MVAPPIIDVAGQMSTIVRLFNPYAGPITIHGDAVMASMEEASVMRVYMNEESPLDQYKY